MLRDEHSPGVPGAVVSSVVEAERGWGARRGAPGRASGVAPFQPRRDPADAPSILRRRALRPLVPRCARPDPAVKACPFCAEPVAPAAPVCPRCGRDLEAPTLVRRVTLPLVPVQTAPTRRRAGRWIAAVPGAAGVLLRQGIGGRGHAAAAAGHTQRGRAGPPR